MDMDICTPDQPFRVPWDRLRSWIDAAEASEKQSGSNAHISRAQLSALSLLVPFTQEEEFQEDDYVSSLMKLTQAQRLPSPVFNDNQPIEIPVDGAFQLRWQCVCVLPWCNESFPRQRAQDSAPIPFFASKKKAKQYAAKEALSHLTGHPSPTTPQPETPKKRKETSQTPPTTAPQSPRFQTPRKIQAALKPPPASSSRRSSSKSRPFANPLQRLSSNGSGSLSSSSGIDGDELYDIEKKAVFENISRLSGRLGIAPPRYLVEQEMERPNFFGGRAEFAGGARVPLDVAVVAGVLGKEQARLQLAQKVLAWLLREDKARQDLADSLLR